jgi:hypothetical protein
LLAFEHRGLLEDDDPSFGDRSGLFTGGGLTSRFKVRFTYVEPGYARARGIDEVPYVAAFEVNARDPDEAILLATELFRDAHQQSGVSWAREIRSATWRLLSRVVGD